MQRMSEWIQRHSKTVMGLLSISSAIGLAFYAPFEQTNTPIPTFDLFSSTAFAAIFRCLLGLAAGFILSRVTLPKVTVRRLRYALWIAVFFSLSCVLGAQLQVHGTLWAGWLTFALNLLCFLGLCAFFLLFFLALLTYGGSALRWLGNNPLEAKLQNARLWDVSNTRRSYALFFLVQAVLLLCWLPLWLAYFPGLANYDIISHMEQCVTNRYSTLHPLLYTLLLKACLWLASLLGGETTLAIALLCCLQLLLMSAVLAYAIVQMRRYGAGVLACIFVLFFFVVIPVFPLLAISTTKDVPYAAFTLLLMVQIFSLFRRPMAFLSSWKSCLAFILTGTAMGLLRYNGIVSLAVFTVMILFSRQTPRKRTGGNRGFFKLRITGLLAFTALLTWLGTMGLNAATQAAPSFVTLRDMASLPSQQLVRAALEMEPDSEEYREVVQWYSGASMLIKYRPRLADYTKRYINVDHDNGWRGFAETWLTTARNHPKAYMEAFLELTRGLWFVHDLSHANIYPEGIPSFGYLLNNQVDCADHIEACAPTIFSSKLPGLQAFYNALTTENLYLQVPVLRLLFSIGFQCWLSVLLFLAACYRRDRAMACAMGWSLCLLAVLAFAPAVLVRYTLPVFLGNGVGVLMMMRQKTTPKTSRTA